MLKSFEFCPVMEEVFSWIVHHSIPKSIVIVRLQLVNLKHFLGENGVLALPKGWRFCPAARWDGPIYSSSQICNISNSSSLFSYETKANFQSKHFFMNNVFVTFSSFVYDGCVSHTDLQKQCQSWDIIFSKRVAEYKQYSSVLIHIV